MLGIDTALDSMSTELDVFLAEGQLLTRSDADLLLHDVDAGDHLRDGVFNLHAGVHLDEIELAVLKQELESARTAIADLATGFGTAFTDLVA